MLSVIPKSKLWNHVFLLKYFTSKQTVLKKLRKQRQFFIKAYFIISKIWKTQLMISKYLELEILPLAAHHCFTQHPPDPRTEFCLPNSTYESRFIEITCRVIFSSQDSIVDVGFWPPTLPNWEVEVAALLSCQERSS